MSIVADEHPLVAAYADQISAAHGAPQSDVPVIAVGSAKTMIIDLLGAGQRQGFVVPHSAFP